MRDRSNRSVCCLLTFSVCFLLLHFFHPRPHLSLSDLLLSIQGYNPFSLPLNTCLSILKFSSFSSTSSSPPFLLPHPTHIRSHHLHHRFKTQNAHPVPPPLRPLLPCGPPPPYSLPPPNMVHLRPSSRHDLANHLGRRRFMDSLWVGRDERARHRSSGWVWGRWRRRREERLALVRAR